MSPTAPVVVSQTLRRRRGLTEQAATAAVDQACRRLRLPTIRSVLDEALTVAGKEQLSYQGFLAELLLAECDDRDRLSSIRRVKSANFPRDKWLGDFDYEANPNINQATINTLATGDWIRKGLPLCLIGDSGPGKSHLLIGLGTAAAEKGFRVKYILATRLVNELVEAEDEKVLAKTIATNESSSGWTKTFTDPRLCAAIVDRLTFKGAIIETGTDSYRLAHTKTQQHADA